MMMCVCMHIGFIDPAVKFASHMCSEPMVEQLGVVKGLIILVKAP